MNSATSLTPLKDLYELLGDSRKGYVEVADKVDSIQIAGRLLRLSNERQGMQQAVARIIISLRPAYTKLNGGTLKGNLHRTWMELRKAMSGTTEAALLDECIRGENYLLDRYTAVIVDEQTPQEALQELREQQASVDVALSGLEQLRASFK